MSGLPHPGPPWPPAAPSLPTSAGLHSSSQLVSQYPLLFPSGPQLTLTQKDQGILPKYKSDHAGPLLQAITKIQTGLAWLAGPSSPTVGPHHLDSPLSLSRSHTGFPDWSHCGLYLEFLIGNSLTLHLLYLIYSIHRSSLFPSVC